MIKNSNRNLISNKEKKGLDELKIEKKNLGTIFSVFIGVFRMVTMIFLNL